MRRWTTYAAYRLTEPGAQKTEDQMRLRRRSERQIRAWVKKFLPTWLGPLAMNTVDGEEQSNQQPQLYAAD